MTLSIIFAILTIFGESYKKLDSWDLVFQNPIRSLSLLVIYTITFYILKKVLTNLIKKMETIKYKNNKITNAIFEKHPFIITLLIILICWLPIIIIKYPGTPGWDFYHFLNNYYNYDKGLTQHFPLLYVFFCVYIIKFGIFIKDISLGLFILTMIHAATMLIAFSLTFVYLKKWKVHYIYRWTILLFYCFNPIFSNYATTIYHDIPYSAFILIYILLLADICVEKGNITKNKMISLSIISLLILWSRKNGLYIVVPTDIIILFKYIIKNKNKKFNISAIAIPVIAFIISENIFGIYYFHTSILEIITIPIQTLARYSRDYNEDISIEEKMDVNGFINYDLAGKLYNPVLVDPARNNAGNYFSTNEEKIKFFKVWTKLFFRHPTVYIQAIINNTYDLYYPFKNSTYIFTKVKEEENYSTIMNFDEPGALKPYKEMIRKCIDNFENIPIICYLDDPGIYTWFFIVLLVEIIKKEKEYLLPMVPLIMTILCCIAGPTIYWNTRYAFPIIFAIIPLFALYRRVHIDNNCLDKKDCNN